MSEHLSGNLSEQVMALWDSAAWLAAEGGDELARMLLRLRLWAVYDLNELAGSARQAIAAGEPLAVDSERVLGPDYSAPWPRGTTSPAPAGR